MPRVPVDVPQVGQSPAQLPGFQAPTVQPMQNFAPSTIGSIGQGLSQAGDSFSRIGSSIGRQANQLAEEQERIQNIAQAEQERRARIAQAEQDKIDDTVATEKVNDLRIALKRYDTDYKSKTFDNAAKSFPAYRSDVGKTFKEIEESLANPVQKELFRSKGGYYVASSEIEAQEHAKQQSVEYQKKTFSAGVSLDLEQYSLSIDNVIAGKKGIDPAVVKASIKNNLAKLAEANGLDPNSDVAKAYELSVLSDMHNGALRRNANSVPPDVIRQYIEANKGEMSSETYGAWAAASEKDKKKDDDKQFAARLLSDAFSKFGDKPMSDNDKKAISDFLFKELKDGRMTGSQYDASMTLVDRFATISKQASTEKSDAILDGLKNAAFKASEGDAARPRAGITDDEIIDQAFRSDPSGVEYLKSVGRLKEFVYYVKNKSENEFVRYSNQEVSDAIKANAQSDPDYYAKTDEVSFVNQYKYSLSKNEMDLHRANIRNAHGKASKEDQAKITDSRLIDSILVNEKIMNQDGTPANGDAQSVVRSREFLSNSITAKLVNSGEFKSTEEKVNFLTSELKNSKIEGKGDQAKRIPSLGDQVPITVNQNGKTMTAALSDVDNEMLDEAKAAIIEYNSKPFIVETLNGQIINAYATEFDAQNAVRNGDGMTRFRVLPKIDQNDMSEVIRAALRMNIDRNGKAAAEGRNQRPINYASRITSIRSVVATSDAYKKEVDSVYDKVFNDNYNESERVPVSTAVKATGMTQEAIQRLHPGFIRSSSTARSENPSALQMDRGDISVAYITLGDLAKIVKQIPKSDYENALKK